MDQKVCNYCNNILECNDNLKCIKCNEYFDIKCLKRPGTPGNLVGDIFYKFTCINCSSNQIEQFVRTHMPWTMIIVLTLYNLSVNCKGLSHHGYFHWRSHICYFIDKNWNYFLESFERKKKTWTGTVSGTLSRNTPEIFLSGQELFNEAGWWKLAHNITPKQYFDLYTQLREDKQKDEDDVDVCSDFTVDHDAKRIRLSEDEEICSRVLPYMGRFPYRTQNKRQKPDENTQDDLVDFLESCTTDSDNMLDNFPLNNASDDGDDILPSLSSSTNELDWPSESCSSNNVNYQPRIVQVTNFQATDNDDDDIDTDEFSMHKINHIKKEINSDDDDEQYLVMNNIEEYSYQCEPSLFTKTEKRRPPWEDDDDDHDNSDTSDVNDDNENHCQNIEMMSHYDEKLLLKRLRNVLRIGDSNNVPSWIRRFYRKLCLRELKRSLGRPIFDIDNINLNRCEKSEKILDRFHHIICSSSIINHKNNVLTSFYATLAGTTKYELFESPHTGRILHPFIYRNEKCMPQWVKLMCEMQYKVNNKMPERSTIDYCYLRPHHVAAVNGLLQQNFWSGIDMSECLSYPDFTIVALYKKLVIGCAFLVPDVSHNEAYVSFMTVRTGWQRAGIATFMLYHLTQTCMGRDITLHVSATNPAICLYQKFGFKIESFILDFYDKYLPFDTSNSGRHAFFLRMKR